MVTYLHINIATACICFRARHGRTLILDGIIQCTEHDEYSYQEMMALVPLCAHPRPTKVLIVGGGDGGVAREVAKHPLVEEIHQVEIDERVIAVSKQFLPHMAVGFDSPKLTLHIGDGFEFMRTHSNAFDVIITDSSDPVGPNASLFQESYFELLRKALKPGGVVCSQAGTTWIDLEYVAKFKKSCEKFFKMANLGVVSVPTYPTGQIGFLIGSDHDPTVPKYRFSEEVSDKLKLRYYDAEVHKAAFTLPRSVRRYLSRVN